ncbi:MAG TPA: LysM domain-containing protein [Candidatus Limnocylindrales bacterium]
MDGSIREPAQRTLTPAVLASAAFVAICAAFAITYVAARGGLQMPVAPIGSAAAVASPAPTTDQPTQPAPSIAPVPTPLPSPSQPPPSATPEPTPEPTVEPTPGPTLVIPTLRPNDPLADLRACPGHPGCYRYVVQRLDTLSTIADRFLVPMGTILALNPQITDPSVVVTNSTMYLGRSRFVRLDPCPDGALCWLYVVRAGDSLAGIANRYALTRDAILEINPGLPRPLTIDQVIRLPDVPA